MIDEDSSEARKVTRLATSSGPVVVANGAFSSNSSTISGMSHMPSVSGVRTRPGPMALTRIPAGPSSMAATWASMAAPALEVQ